MSQDPTERPHAPERAVPSTPPPPGYGAHPRPSIGVPPEAAAGPPAAPPVTGPRYGPVHRHGYPQVELRDVHPSAATAFPAPTGQPGPGSWPPVGSSPAPTYPLPADLSPGPYAPWPPAPPAPVSYGPPPWGPTAAWVPPRRDDYAPWIRRVAATAVDAVPIWIAAAVLVAGYLPTYRGLFNGDYSVPPRYWLVLVGTLLYVGSFALTIYNHYVLAGRTGQSLGKRLLGIWLVSRTTGRPVGALNAFLRNLLHILDGFGYVGYLWPLWDDEHQTFADKIAQTVVVRTPVPPLTEQERRQAWVV